MKLFGIELFKHVANINQEERKKLESANVIPDFYQLTGAVNINTIDTSQYITYVGNTWTATEPMSSTTSIVGNVVPSTPEKHETKGSKKTPVTPKQLYDLHALHEKTTINVAPEYVDEQLNELLYKLKVATDDTTDMRNSVRELVSIIIRLQNRKKYAKFSSFYEQYPYAKTSRIAGILKTHDHLKLGAIAQFVPSLPKEATDTIKNYTRKTSELCGKQPIFYIIADRKDFEKTNKRKDPILLAQSPFGHWWQILGAWDEEMILLEEL
jgi:hypothetical protein